MTQLTATAWQVRISPRKLRIITDLVKGLSAQQAIAKLQFLPKKGGLVLVKVIKNALNTAKAKNLPIEPLRIKAIQINEGSRLKRWLPAPRGRSYRITKKSSHISITLSDEIANQTRIRRELSRKRIRDNSSKNT